MLQVRGLGKAFRGDALFRALDFQINVRDRIGLVGDNGTGKTTLMKMLAGLIPPAEGGVIGARGLPFGSLPQDGLFVHGRALFEEALSVFEGLRNLERECRALEHELAEMPHSGADYEKKLERYSAVSQQFRLHGGYALEARTGSVPPRLCAYHTDGGPACEHCSGRRL